MATSPLFQALPHLTKVPLFTYLPGLGHWLASYASLTCRGPAPLNATCWGQRRGVAPFLRCLCASKSTWLAPFLKITCFNWVLMALDRIHQVLNISTLPRCGEQQLLPQVNS